MVLEGDAIFQRELWRCNQLHFVSKMFEQEQLLLELGLIEVSEWYKFRV